MSYRVLARKYRPQTFEEIVGQSHVATTLANALRSGKIAHAYLFSGPRGVGKTTTARILAKALNCEKGPTPAPCNACESCQRITNGQELVDVLEIDAASNRGIEEIRELRENALYAPAHSRYKVYIVDEAHQITHDAFNAFLKTLEEPPAHAVFILATTEHQKIPSTILSRCQIFRFRRVSAEDVRAQLERVLSQEKISVDKPAIERIARAAAGSLRDALSLLDQALAYASDGVTVQQVETLLGFLPGEFLQGFAGALLARDPAAILEWVKRLTEEGWDLSQFVRDFREYLRQAMVDQISASVKPDALRLIRNTVSLAQFLQIIKGMGQCLDEMRWNDDPRVVLELYGLRLAQPFVDAGELLRRIESLEKGMPSLSLSGEAASEFQGKDQHDNPSVSVRHSGPFGGHPERSEGSRSVSPQDKLREESSLVNRKVQGEILRHNVPQDDNIQPPDDNVATPPSPHNADAPSPVSSEAAAQWKQFLAELWKKPMVASQMEKARLKSATGAEWVIAFGDGFGLELAQRSKALIEESAAKALGHPVAVQLVHQPGLAAEPVDEIMVALHDHSSEPPKQADERQPVIMQDAGVQKILQVFNGRIRQEESPQ